MIRLLGLKLTSYKNSLLYGEDRRKALTGLVFFLALAGGLLYLLITRVPRNQPLGPTGNFLLAQGLKIGFLLALFFLLIGGINTALKSLYLDSDLGLLQSLPISTRTVFSYKFVSAWIDNSTFVFSIAIPVLVGYGLYNGSGSLYYLVMVVGLSAFTALMTGLASLLTLLSVKIAPPKRLRRVLRGLGTLVGAVLYGVFYLNFYTGKTGAGLSSSQITRLKSIFSHPAVEWLPSGWLATSLSFFAGQVGLKMFLLNFGLLVVTGVGIFWISRSFLMETLKTGMVGIREVPTAEATAEGQPEKIDVSKGSFGFGITSKKPAYWAIAKKEYLTYIRNFQVLSRLFFPLTMSIVIPIVMFAQAGSAQSYVTPYFGLITAWFFVYMAGSQISLLSFFSEKGNTSGIFSSPLAGEKMVRIKTLTYSVPTLVVAEIYHIIGSIIFGAGIKWIVVGLALIPFVSFGMNSIGVSVAAAFGKPDVVDPRKSLPGYWRFLIFPISVLYLGLAGGAVVCLLHPQSLPYVDYFGQFVRRLGGGLLFVLVTSSVSFFSIKLAGNRLHRREW